MRDAKNFLSTGDIPDSGVTATIPITGAGKQLAVPTEGEPIDAALMDQWRAGLSGLHIPQFDLIAIACACQPVPVGAEGNSLNLGIMLNSVNFNAILNPSDLSLHFAL